MTEAQLASTNLCREGVEMQKRLPRYAAMNLARLNGAHLNIDGEESQKRIAIDVITNEAQMYADCLHRIW